MNSVVYRVPVAVESGKASLPNIKNGVTYGLHKEAEFLVAESPVPVEKVSATALYYTPQDPETLEGTEKAVFLVFERESAFSEGEIIALQNWLRVVLENKIYPVSYVCSLASRKGDWTTPDYKPDPSEGKVLAAEITPFPMEKWPEFCEQFRGMVFNQINYVHAWALVGWKDVEGMLQVAFFCSAWELCRVLQTDVGREYLEYYLPQMDIDAA